MVEDITKSTTQISNGLLDSIGVDLKGMINSFVTGKAIGQGLNNQEHKQEKESATDLTVDNSAVDADTTETVDEE